MTISIDIKLSMICAVDVLTFKLCQLPSESSNLDNFLLQMYNI